MFGQEAGAERNQGKMNEFVVTKRSGKAKAFWILHRRGESSTSVLIVALVDVGMKDMDINATVVELKDEVTFTLATWSNVKDREVNVFGKKGLKTTLDIAATSATRSGVIGWEQFVDE